MSIEVRHVSKRFGNFAALRDVSLRVDDGELVALLGPSGSGKTTLLRLIAGLEQPDADPRTEILFHDAHVTHRPVGQRQVGFVFQHYALFRHMTVAENIAFAMRVRPKRERLSRSLIQQRVHELLRLIQLEGLGGRYPAQLSGGQRQRVALARALAVEPKVLLLDEPFGALDAKVRKELRQWLRRLHEEIQMTSVFVTHDQEEAFELADRVVVMNRGQIEQIGRPQEIFDHPANAFVMSFLGHVNVFHGRIENGRARWGTLELEFPEYPSDATRAAQVYVRPHEFHVERVPNGGPHLAARVLRITPAGALSRVGLATAESDVELQVELSPDRLAQLDLQPGETVYVSPRQARVFPEYVI